jgi:hypothetical protein
MIEQKFESQDSKPDHAPDGTDLNLIRWMLSLTVEERLSFWESQLQSILEMRRAYKNATLR